MQTSLQYWYVYIFKLQSVSHSPERCWISNKIPKSPQASKSICFAVSDSLNQSLLVTILFLNAALCLRWIASWWVVLSRLSEAGCNKGDRYARMSRGNCVKISSFEMSWMGPFHLNAPCGSSGVGSTFLHSHLHLWPWGMLLWTQGLPLCAREESLSSILSLSDPDFQRQLTYYLGLRWLETSNIGHDFNQLSQG